MLAHRRVRSDLPHALFATALRQGAAWVLVATPTLLGGGACSGSTTKGSPATDQDVTADDGRPVGDGDAAYDCGVRGHACRQDGSCDAGLTCLLDICREPCDPSLATCQSGETCEFGFCLPANPLGCGDGVVAGDEQCDDGNAESGDGCTPQCRCESGWSCDGGRPVPICGDGLQVGDEACDDHGRTDRCCTDQCEVRPGWAWDALTQACACLPGNTGADCASCLAGYQHHDGDGACEPTCSLAIDQGLAGCGPYVACDDTSGTPVCGGCVVYVAVGATEDGRDWSHATGSVQAGIAAAVTAQASATDGACEVWLASGTYYVLADDTDGVHLAEKVAVLGGFVRGDYLRSARQPQTNLTILDGGTDAAATTFASHVVYGASDSRLEGVTVQHGHSPLTASNDGDGAGLFVAGVHDMVVHDCVFQDNTAGHFGGGVALDDANTIELSDVTLTGNVAASGGGFASLGATFALLALVVEGNSAGYGQPGSGLAIYDGSVGEIEGGALNHSVDGYEILGGSIYAHNATLSVHGTTFDQNSATSGAALAMVEGTLIVDECTFTDNAGGVGAGAIELRDVASAEITNSHFTGNTSGYSATGGAAVSASRSTYLRIEACSFDNNNGSSSSTGGTIGVATADTVELVSLQVTNSRAIYGGAVQARDVRDLSIAGCTLAEVQAAYGGAIYYAGPSPTVAAPALAITHSQINDASANANGGAVAVVDGGDVTLTDLTISATSASASGGGLYLEGGAATTSPSLRIEQLTLDDLTSGGTGGCVYLTAFPWASLSQTSFSRCHSSGSGAGLYAAGTEVLSITDSLFSSNTTTASGGALYANSDVASVTVARTDFSDNQAHLGGGIYLSGTSELVVVASSFITNHSQWHGGAAALENVTAAYVASSQFEDNASGIDGGALFANGVGTLSVTADVLTGNSAGSDGGAIAGLNVGRVTLDTTTLDGNSAGGGGGGGYLIGTASSLLVLKGSLVDSNVATWSGAGIEAVAFSHATISDTRVSNNNAGDLGGGLYVVQAPFDISASVLDNNHSVNGGGGAFVEVSSSARMIQCHFTRNGAGMSGSTAGGGALVLASSASLSDCTFSDNSAAAGGGLAVESGATMTLTRSAFVGNQAAGTTEDAGGGALLTSNGSTTSSSNLLLAFNDSSGFGGAVQARNGSNVTLAYVTAVENSALTEGGFAAASAGSTVVNVNSIVWKNRTNGDATQGALFADVAGTVSVTTSILEAGSSNCLAAAGGTCGPLTGVDASDPQLAGRIAVRGYGAAPSYDTANRGTVFTDSASPPWSGEAGTFKVLRPDHSVAGYFNAAAQDPGRTYLVMGDVSDTALATTTYELYDFRIASGSPGCGAASPYGSINADIDNHPRSSPYDLGAFESCP